MKKFFIIAIATALPFLGNSQTTYASISLGFIPQIRHASYASMQLSVGYEFHNNLFFEYNQNIALSIDEWAPKYIQIRVGQSFKINREYTIATCAGYSLTSVPKDRSKKIGHGATAAIFLKQKITREASLKYELSINNGWHIIPSIGAMIKF